MRMDALLEFSIATLIIATGSVLWYLVVASCLYSCLNKSPTFILLFSQALCDIYALSQSAYQPIIRLAGIPKETFLPDRWLSVIHGTFELISLPHYIVIALNRALFLIDHTKMNLVFSTRNTIVICIAMWIIPIIANVLLHIFAQDDDEGFYLFSTTQLEMGGKSMGLSVDSYLSFVFDISFYITVIIVVATYVIAIIWHSVKTQAFLTSTGAGSTPRGSHMEMRLTMVCLVNLLPPTITTILEYTWTDRDNVGGFVFAVFTILDNSVNSIVLPLFSQLLRDGMKRRIHAVMAWKRPKKIDPKLFDARRRSTTSTVAPPL